MINDNNGIKDNNGSSSDAFDLDICYQDHELEWS